jgi:Kelch motif
MRMSLGAKHLTACVLFALMGVTAGVLAPACRGQPLAAQGTGPQGAVSRWVSTGQLNTARYSHTATLLQDGRVLVAGGQSNDCCSNDGRGSAEIYDPVSGVWSATGSLRVPRTGHTATLLLDGRVLVIGVPSELYDPGTGSWTLTGSLSFARDGSTATLLKSGKVLVAGGSNSNSAEIYDPATGKWHITGPLREARYGHTATLLRDGRVLVAGGGFDIDVFNGYGLQSAELYDPVSETWGPAADLNAVGSGDIAVLLADNKVLVLDGYNVPERYDPDAGTWRNTGSPGQLQLFTATLLSTGQVLIAGGVSTQESGRYLSSAQVYDDRSGAWSPTSSMMTGRWRHTATLLADGRVLVAGGLGVGANGETALRSAELYESAVMAISGTIGPGFTGSWYDPAQSGHGLFIQVLPDNRFLAAWFAFNPAGTLQAWFTGVGSYGGNTATITAVEQPTGGRWIPNFDAGKVVHNTWGTLTFTFADCDHGKVDFNSVAGYGAGRMNLTRLTQPAGLTCP